MYRNTNINDLLFPVWEQPVYLKEEKVPVPGYKAILGQPDSKSASVFSIVSNGYRLVSNLEMLDLGKQIHRKLFPGANADSFEIFNVIAPASKSFCHVDIIDKNYILNIWAQETYIPFVRMHNSYNKTRSLQFDIGFCRKLCDNGVIFEQNTVKFKFSHTKQALQFDSIANINVSHLKGLEQDFIKKTTESSNIQLPKKFFLPLSAKILNRKFNVQSADLKIREAANTKLGEFKNSINTYINEYIHSQQQGETAYALFNVITVYVSNNKHLPATAINGLQAKCGMWINEVGKLVTQQNFRWEAEIKDFAFLLENE